MEAVLDENQLSIDEELQKKHKELNSLNKEEEKIKKKIKELNVKEKLNKKLSLVDSFIKEIALNSQPKTEEIRTFSGVVEYSYMDENIITKKMEEKTRSFTLNFNFHYTSEDEKIYAVKIRNKWFLKEDLLNLYLAFQEEISKNFSIWLDAYHKTKEKREKIKEENEEQLLLFKEDFGDSYVSENFITLRFYSNYEGDWIDFEFPITIGKFFGLKLNKNEILMSQDIFYIYFNFNKIKKQFLNK